MKTENKTSKFNVGDIVTLAKDYRDFANLDFAQPQIQVYYVRTVNADGTITLAGVLNDIPAKYIEGVPIESELTKQIYYEINHARPYELGKVCQQEDVYSRPPFMIMMAERLGNTPLWEKMQAEEFHYVHELQHWLIEFIGASRICINPFYGKREPIKV